MKCKVYSDKELYRNIMYRLCRIFLRKCKLKSASVAGYCESF